MAGDAADDVYDAQAAQSEELDLAMHNVVDECCLATCKLSQTLQRLEDGSGFRCGECGVEFDV